MSLEDIASLATPVVLALFAWLLKRAIDGVDSKLDRLDSRVSLLAAKDGEHDSAIVELRIRTGHLEVEMGRAANWRDDLTGFLQSLGFRKRDGAAQ